MIMIFMMLFLILICEIRDKSLCISGFDLCNLNDLFTVYVPDLFCVSCIVHVCCIDLDFVHLVFVFVFNSL